jgi:HAD superfamily hydrolase (TIGR01549 family)
MHRAETAFLFDLDGTLVDTVYHHVLAWHQALQNEGIELSVWRIHRRIGMSGGLLTEKFIRETGMQFDADQVERLHRGHAEAFRKRAHDVRPLPGARELLATLTDSGIRWAIATSGRIETARPTLEMLGIDLERVPVITRDVVKYAKPEPDLFLAAAERLGVGSNEATVVGDSVWDMLAAVRARFLGIGLLTGGYSTEELEHSGAYRVFDDPAHLLANLDEVGGRR